MDRSLWCRKIKKHCRNDADFVNDEQWPCWLRKLFWKNKNFASFLRLFHQRELHLLRWLKYCSIEVFKVFAILIDDSTFTKYELFISGSHHLIITADSLRNSLPNPLCLSAYRTSSVDSGIDRFPRSIHHLHHKSHGSITINTRLLVTVSFAHGCVLM